MRLKFQKFIFCKASLLNHNIAQSGTRDVPLAMVGYDADPSGSIVSHDYMTAGASGNCKTGSFKFLDDLFGFGRSEFRHYLLLGKGGRKLQPDEGSFAGGFLGNVLVLFQNVNQIKFHRFGDVFLRLFKIITIIREMIKGGYLGTHLSGFFVKGINYFIFGNHSWVPPDYLSVF